MNKIIIFVLKSKFISICTAFYMRRVHTVQRGSCQGGWGMAYRHSDGALRSGSVGHSGAVER